MGESTLPNPNALAGVVATICYKAMRQHTFPVTLIIIRLTVPELVPWILKVDVPSSFGISLMLVSLQDSILLLQALTTDGAFDCNEVVSFVRAFSLAVLTTVGASNWDEVVSFARGWAVVRVGTILELAMTVAGGRLAVLCILCILCILVEACTLVEVWIISVLLSPIEWPTNRRCGEYCWRRVHRGRLDVGLGTSTDHIIILDLKLIVARFFLELIIPR